VLYGLSSRGTREAPRVTNLKPELATSTYFDLTTAHKIYVQKCSSDRFPTDYSETQKKKILTKQKLFNFRHLHKSWTQF
jgi:hypothetical protein